MLIINLYTRGDLDKVSSWKEISANIRDRHVMIHCISIVYWPVG